MRQDEAFEFTFASFDGHRQGSLDGTKASVERQLTHNNIFTKVFAAHLTVGGNDAYSQRQIIGRPFLTDVGGSHIDDNVALRYVMATLD